MGKVVSAILTWGFPRRREVRPVSHKDGFEGATPSAGILDGKPDKRAGAVSKAVGPLTGMGCNSSAFRHGWWRSLVSAFASEAKGRGCESRSPDHASVREAEQGFVNLGSGCNSRRWLQGVVAHLGERFVRNEEVAGAIPADSITGP